MTQNKDDEPKLMINSISVCSVCHRKDQPIDEVLEWLRGFNPSGTTGNWQHMDAEHLREFPQQAPVQCADDPERLHTMFLC